MKNRVFSTTANFALTMFILSITSIACFGRGMENGGKEPIGVFLNGKQINIVKDSVEITATGTLSLSTLSPEYENGEKVKFRVVIRRTTYNGAFPILTYDIRFQDGEEFTLVEVEKILLKAKIGDEILIIPVDADQRFENTREPFHLFVGGDRC